MMVVHSLTGGTYLPLVHRSAVTIFCAWSAIYILHDIHIHIILSIHRLIKPGMSTITIN